MSESEGERERTGAGSGWVRVRVTAGELEAQQIRGFFEANEIPCRFQGESLRMTHGLTLAGLGAVEIYVPAEHAGRARELLAEVEHGALELPAENDEGTTFRK